MRRHYAKDVIDEKIINVERVVAVLFDIGKKYGVRIRENNGWNGKSVVGKCVARDEHRVILESETFDGFDKETIKKQHTIKTGEIFSLWEVIE